MFNIFRKRNPIYDFKRYYFKFGDIIEFNGSHLFCLESTFTRCTFLALRRGFGFDKMEEVTFSYKVLPYYEKGEFKSLRYKISSSCAEGKFIRTMDGDVLITKVKGKVINGICVDQSSDCYAEEVRYKMQ